VTKTILAFLILASASADKAVVPEQTNAVSVAIGHQIQFTPIYRVGNITVVNVDVADFRVGAGRRDIMIIGKSIGITMISVFDQQGRRHQDVEVSVYRKLDSATQSQVEARIRDWPRVSIATLGGVPVLTGEVESEAQRDQAVGFATVAGMKTALTVRPLAMVPPGPAAPTIDTAMFRYEIVFYEAAASFTTGSYGTRVQPSGRSLYRTSLDVRHGASGQLVVAPQFPTAHGNSTKPRPSIGRETGFRITLVPGGDSAGRHTVVTVETNLPLVRVPFDPNQWRAFKDTFPLDADVPIAIGGNELLAAPPPADSTHPVRDRVATVLRLPGVRDARGINELPIFGAVVSSKDYRDGQTQLLLVIRPLFLADPHAGGR
jgi:Pilus formation protein N terminal region